MVIAVHNRSINLYDDNFVMILSTLSDKYLAQVSLLQDERKDSINIKIVDLATEVVTHDGIYLGYLETGNIFVDGDNLIFKADDRICLFDMLSKELNYLTDENEESWQYSIIGFYDRMIYLHNVMHNVILSYNISTTDNIGLQLNATYSLHDTILDHHLLNSNAGLLYVSYNNSGLYQLLILQTAEVLIQLSSIPLSFASNNVDRIIIQTSNSDIYYCDLQGNINAISLIDKNNNHILDINNHLLGSYKSQSTDSIWIYNKLHNIYEEFVINNVFMKSARSTA